VRRGFVSVNGAKNDYGVVIRNDNTLDEAATLELRKKMIPAIEARKAGHYCHGPGRQQFERVWTLQRYDALTTLLGKVPVTWRYFVKHRLFAALEGHIAPPDGGAQDVYAHFAGLAQGFTELAAAATIAADCTAQTAAPATA
ncbi:MAG: hypothetical protein ABI822_17490, partial [Bryobacteraceae bacterium]